MLPEHWPEKISGFYYFKIKKQQHFILITKIFMMKKLERRKL